MIWKQVELKEDQKIIDGKLYESEDVKDNEFSTYQWTPECMKRGTRGHSKEDLFIHGHGSSIVFIPVREILDLKQDILNGLWKLKEEDKLTNCNVLRVMTILDRRFGF